MKKGTKLYSILKLKCPRCQRGNLFINPKLFTFHKALEMPNHCTHCHQDFKIEPGFYTIALWISYPILIVVLLPLMIFGITNGVSNYFILTFICFCILVQVPLMRIARAIALNMFVSYDNKYD